MISIGSFALLTAREGSLALLVFLRAVALLRGMRETAVLFGREGSEFFLMDLSSDIFDCELCFDVSALFGIFWDTKTGMLLVFLRCLTTSFDGLNPAGKLI